MGVSIYTSPNPERYLEYNEEGESLAIRGEEILQRSYSGFNAWRVALAKAAGTATVEGYLGPQPDVEYSEFDGDNYLGVWEDGTEPEDPLYLLYIHSDCDGILPHRHLGALADRLEEILPNLLGDNEDPMMLSRTVTEGFIAGLRSAYRNGHGIVFS